MARLYAEINAEQLLPSELSDLASGQALRKVRNSAELTSSSKLSDLAGGQALRKVRNSAEHI